MSYDRLRILVPMDGSPASESILPALLPIVRSRASEITVLRVVEDLESVDAARADLHRIARTLLMDGVRTVSRLEWGRPADEIDHLARPSRHDLLAMTTHGRSGLSRAVLGSTAETVLRRAKIPLLLNRPGSRVGDWRRIVLALDGSARAEEVLGDLEPLAAALRATVHVLHVTPPMPAMPEIHAISLLPPQPDLGPYIAAICKRLEERGIRAVPANLRDHPAAGIHRYLTENGAGLLALTTRGRSGVERMFAGSVAEEVIRASPVPVLVRRRPEVSMTASA